MCLYNTLATLHMLVFSPNLHLNIQNRRRFFGTDQLSEYSRIEIVSVPKITHFGSPISLRLYLSILSEGIMEFHSQHEL